ncbi:hypothetical protein CNR22_14655 [Sphingobacteriaceae bacterium]|nr:hypothetical protein CNR22_14655 [Sphingobacteriaceae bacterium]
MKRKIFFLLFFSGLCYSKIFAWGAQGHRMIVLIARSQLDRETISNIDFYLNGLSWEEASTWMDDIQREPKYDYMKTWHYVNVPKDKTYVYNKDQINVVTKIEYCLRMLSLKTYQSAEVINETLKILFHLVGDIHQPLHCGYEDDRGGNEVSLYLVQKETNLHRVWDSEIIKNKEIDIWHCAKVLIGMKLTDKRRAEMEKTDVVAWMNESRILLPAVYATNGNKIDQKYLDSNAPLVDAQLIKAGLRLAAILNKYFK